VAEIGPIARQPATVYAAAPEYVPRTAFVSASATDVRVALSRGGELVGEVVDDRGYPVGGATIEVVGTDSDGMPIDETSTTVDFRSASFERLLAGAAPLIPMGDLGVTPGPVPSLPHESLTGAGWGPGNALGRQVDPWVTRADGSFRAAPVPPGSIHVIARHPGYVDATSELTTMRSGGRSVVHLVLRQGGLLEGRVVESDHTPVRRARIELAATHGAFERVVYAKDDGTFAIAGAPEQVQISVARPDAPADIVAQVVESIPDGERHEIEVVLPALRGTVTVHITDDRGYPVDRVEVHVASIEVANPLRRTLFTNEQGNLSLRDAAGLPLRFTLSRAGKSPVARMVEEAPTALTFAMKEGIVGRGVVTARNGRDRLAGAEVTVHAATGTEHVRTDANGAFVARDLAPGRIRLSASFPAYASGSVVVKVGGDANHDADLGTMDLPPAGSAEGEVVDTDDYPVAGARVAQNGAPAYLPIGPLPPDVARTDRMGHFKLTGLPEGRVTLEAYAADLGRARVDDVDIRAGRTTGGVKLVLGASESPPRQPKGTGSLALTLGERGSAGTNTVVVVMVPPNGEAELAGIEPGDELLSVNGHRVQTIESAREWLTGPLGEDVLLALRRDDEEPPVSLLRVRRERVMR
jgi:S1-C subfamily serine protease